MSNGDRKRRKWGCVVACKDADGRIVSWQARYQSPVNPRQRIYRRFGLEFQTEAYRWLDEEHALVIDHKKGIRRWTHPSARTMHGRILFSSYATRFVANLRKKDGSELSGRSKRIQKAALDKLPPWFGETPMCDITEEFVNEWYAKACDEVRPSALEHAVWLLKRLMRAATERQPDGGPPLLSSNPCNLVTRKRPSKRREQAPMTRQEIDTLVEGFPEYYRLSIHLALLVGGLRIGEVCGLQLRDIDLDHRLLYVRHSVTQGPDDLGEYRLDETKTPESHRVVPIPAPVCRFIREHIDRFCPDRDPDTMLFHAIRHPERVLNPTTIQRQFRTAREKNQPRGRDVPLPARDTRDDVHDPGRHTARDHGRARPCGRRRGRPMLPTRGAETQARRRRTTGARISPRRGSGRHQGADSPEGRGNRPAATDRRRTPKKTGRARRRRRRAEPVRISIPKTEKPKNRNNEKPKPVETGIKRNRPTHLSVAASAVATLRYVRRYPKIISTCA